MALKHYQQAVIPALRRLKQEGDAFKASLNYIEKSCPRRNKKKKRKKRREEGREGEKEGGREGGY
jgi:hypothetical protein